MSSSGDDGSSRPWRAIVVLAIGAFAVGTGLFALSGVLGETADDLGVSPAAVGQAVTVYALAYAVGAPLLAVLAGRFPLKPVLVVALALLVLGNLLTAVSPDLPALLLSRIVAAIGAAAYTPAALAAAATLAGRARSGAALAVVQGGLNAALAVGVPIGVGVAGVWSWRGALIVVAVLGIAALVGIVVATGTLPRARPVRLSGVVTLLRSRRAFLVLTVTVLVVGSGISAYTYVSEVFGATVDARGAPLLVLLVVYGIGALAGTLVAGPLTDRVGPRRVLIGAIGLQASTLALVPTVHVVTLAIPLVLVWGAAFTASTPPQQVRLIALAPDSPTVAVSLNSSAIYGGQGLGAVIGGLVLSRGFSASAIPFFAAAIAVLGLVASIPRLWPRSHASDATHPA